MYARLTTFRVKSDKLEEMRRWREENEAKIYAQPGLREWIGMMDEYGEFFVIALFDDEKAARDALPHARALWKEMASMIESEPKARFLNVVAAENLAMRGVVMA
jgi:quinol monooxygenase YgiN